MSYLDTIRQANKIVKVLSDRNGGQVLQLWNPRVQKHMVLKIYDTPVQAYEKLKAISHPVFPEIYDVQYADGKQFVFEAYIDGITVAQVLENGCYTYRGAKKVIGALCDGVELIHAFGVVHRDLKPENVLISKDGAVKLIDFNASRFTDPEKSKDTVVLGTVGYASPEQLGISQCDARTDIYALGVLLNVMLTGEHPSKKLAKGKAGRIVRKCTLIDPDSRFQTVYKLKNAL